MWGSKNSCNKAAAWKLLTVTNGWRAGGGSGRLRRTSLPERKKGVGGSQSRASTSQCAGRNQNQEARQQRFKVQVAVMPEWRLED